MSEPSQRAPIAASPVSVLLFAHALATETAEVVKDWKHHLYVKGRTCEIFLIQEACPEVAAATDATTAARVFTYERAVGFRDVVNEAIRAAQYPLLVFCTADKQYQPADVEIMFKVDEERKKPLIDEVDLIVGYRAGGRPPAWRVMLDLFFAVFGRVVLGIPPTPRVCWLGARGWGRRWIARWIFGVRVQDPECPFRIVRREIFQRLPIQSGGPFVQVEMLAKANHLSCLLAEVPVSWTPPTLAVSDAISFSDDAWLVFREPEFAAPNSQSRARQEAESNEVPAS